ncbi:MAG TPA: hypothetical protein VFQ92_03915, partial [Blastocatellia bacterium]|nr:hypothetical protein [Blastocatellia bacterium]
AQPVVINLDSKLASYFAERLAQEHKSIAQLERLWQEAIVIPFTRLNIDRRSLNARAEITIRIQGGAVELYAN